MTGTPHEVGFLSPDLAHLIQGIRTQNAIWFHFAEQMNRAGQGVVVSYRMGPGDIELCSIFAMLFMIRSLSSYQGALLMAERGMIVEANMLSRSIYENLFCVSALRVEGDKFLMEFERAEQKDLKSKAHWLLEDNSRLDYSGPHAAQKMREYADRMDQEWGKLSALQWKDLAERGGVADAYLYYKILSGNSAHPSMTSLNRYVRGAPTKFQGLQYGADLDGVETCLNMLCNAFLMVGLGTTEIIKDEARQREFSDHARAYAGLNRIPV